MQPLKNLKTIHDHSLTDWLKWIIFAIMMMAPFAAIASKCIYAACNKNAYQSYSGTTKQYIEKQVPTNDVNNEQDLINGNYYYINWNNTTLDNYINTEVNNWEIVFTPIEGMQYDFTEYGISIDETFIYYIQTGTQGKPEYKIKINAYSVSFFIDYNTDAEDPFMIIMTDDELTDYPFTLKGKIKLNYYDKAGITDTIIYLASELFEKCENLTYLEEIEATSLDNVFYYAVDQLNNEPLFNWTQDTGIYNTINTMCEGLTIQNGVIPLLLTYWSFITLIYIVFDLIIGIFTKLTHLLK